MNEIEKMYENCGIKPELHKFPGRDWDDEGLASWYEEKFYPPFTAEKQIELIKFMLHKGIYYDTDGDTYWFHYTDEIENAKYRPFEEAIAEFINDFWQDLTSEEKEQIRGILNG